MFVRCKYVSGMKIKTTKVYNIVIFIQQICDTYQPFDQSFTGWYVSHI